MPRYNGGFIGTDGLDAPDAPTIDSVTAGNEQVSVAFTDAGGGTSDTTSFVVQVSTDGTDYSAGSNTGTSSPIVVASLTNDTAATAKVWAINAYGTSAPSNASSSFTPVAPNYGNRGIIAGGVFPPSYNRSNVMDYATITTTGNFTDFGNLAAGNDNAAGLSSGSRGVFGGGEESSRTNRIQYITFASTGNTEDFGDLTLARERLAGVSSVTRGVFCGGTTGSNTNVMDYITIASTGNATDFGDTNVTQNGQAGASSFTRGLIIGGTSGNRDSIEYITIASTGNGTDFGDLTGEHEQCAAYSNGTTAMIGNDNDGASTKGRIESVTIATLGNATAFGSLTTSEKMNSGNIVANATRALASVGFSDTTSASSNTVEYFTIASAGNGTDFGDLTQARHSARDASASGN